MIWCLIVPWWWLNRWQGQDSIITYSWFNFFSDVHVHGKEKGNIIVKAEELPNSWNLSSFLSIIILFCMLEKIILDVPLGNTLKKKIFFREENMSSLALILKVLSWRVDLIHLPTGNCSWWNSTTATYSYCSTEATIYYIFVTLHKKNTFFSSIH